MGDRLRDDILQRVLSTNKNHIVLEVATGVGKTKIALAKINQLYSSDCKILIVIPRNVLIRNWMDEFKKWGCSDMVNNVTFVTYVSLPKMAGYWDICVFDEAHHLSERCQESLKSFHITNCLFLSATLKREHKWFIQQEWGQDVEFIKVNTKKAIDNDVLPDPKILLIPLELDNTKAECLWYPKKKFRDVHPQRLYHIKYKDRWKYKNYNGPYVIECTQRQYYIQMSSLIEWYKKKSTTVVMRNLWLHECGKRLTLLALWKMGAVLRILAVTQNTRSITFCADIKQSMMLQIPCVNSKVGISNLSKFNEGRINQISCVGMLDEGINPVNCQIGIFNMLNSSLRLQTQRIGRILRHKNPLIIIPYFKDTRDEEIVEGIKEDYQGMIYTLGSINDIRSYLK